MKRYVILLALIAGLFLVLFVLAQTLHIPILTNPEPFLSSGGLGAALLGMGLLTADVVLPVPSSLVMTAHGALFGILAGTALSLAGRAGSFALGYLLGTHSIRSERKLIPEEELAKVNGILGRWGVLAIIATRAVPILSETVAIAAGLSKLPFGRSLLAATLGSLPEALLFAITGAVAGSFLTTSFVFIGIIMVMLMFWFFQSKYGRSMTSRISGKNRQVSRTKKTASRMQKKAEQDESYDNVS